MNSTKSAFFQTSCATVSLALRRSFAMWARVDPLKSGTGASGVAPSPFSRCQYFVGANFARTMLHTRSAAAADLSDLRNWVKQPLEGPLHPTEASSQPRPVR